MDIELAVSRRKPYHHSRVPFAVSWAQKAGCTSVLKWFLFHAGFLDDALSYVSGTANIDTHVYENKVFKARPGYSDELREKLINGVEVINFIRCPYQRVFSSYLHIQNSFFILQTRKGIQSAGLKVRRAILKDVYGEDVCVEYPITFLDYLYWVRAQDLSTIDPHHAPQCSEIYKYGNIRHYRLEDFSNSIQNIESEFDLCCSKSVLENFSGDHHKLKTKVSSATTLKLLERGIPINPSKAFEFPKVTQEILRNTEFAALIEDIFQEDVRLYESLSD